MRPLKCMFLAIIVFIALYEVKESFASPIQLNCKKEWEDGFLMEIDPYIQKSCGWRFKIYSRQEVRKMEQWERFYLVNK